MKNIKTFELYEKFVTSESAEKFVSFFSKYGNKAKDAIKKFSDNMRTEAAETKEASEYVAKYMKGETLTKEESDAIRTQFHDILKMVGIGVPLALIPGASILIPLLIKFAEKNNIKLLPSSFNEDKK